MSNALVEEISLENIANAIRNKNGLSSTYTPSQMASAISAFEKSGFDIDDVALRTVSGNISGNALFVNSYAFYNCCSLTTANFPNCINIVSSAFMSCSSLTTANFPNCTSIGSSAFTYCYSLTTANFPNCTRIGMSAFGACYSLITVSFPNCISIYNYAFYNCSSLTTAHFPNCYNIGSFAFRNCYNFISLYLLKANWSSTIPSLKASAFLSTPIGGYSTSAGRYGNIYVPSYTYSYYISATNWALVSSRIVSCSNVISGYTPYESTTFTRNGLTFSFVRQNIQYFVTVNGTASNLTYYNIIEDGGSFSPIVSNKAYMATCFTNTIYGSVGAYVDFYDSGEEYVDTGGGALFNNESGNECAWYVTFSKGVTLSDWQFAPILYEIPE